MTAFARGLILSSAIITASSATAGGYWQEDFGHNNPAFYTNMNGQPDNLTIMDGVAQFSGAGGAYYARQDLPIQLSEFDFSRLYCYPPNPTAVMGTVGIGWFSPTLDQGVSVHVDYDADTESLIRHDGWSSSVVLDTAFRDPKAPIVLYHWFEFGWRTGAIINTIPTVPPDDDMFFFMYGSGLGTIDFVEAAPVPEPSGIAAIGIGAATLLLLRRRRKLVR